MARISVNQGTLNRLKAQMVFPAFPTLTITAPYLLPEMIDIAFEGNATDQIPTVTGFVTSPSPVQLARITVHLNRAQAFANIWKQQIESNCLLGACTLYPDAPTIDPFQLDNCCISTGLDRMTFAGRDAGFTLGLVAAYNINDFLWN